MKETEFAKLLGDLPENYILQAQAHRSGGRYAVGARRPVLKFSATGELLECYSSARQAAKQNYFSYQAIIDRCNGKCKRHVLAPDGNYYAWDNTVGVRKAKEDLRALARQEGRPFAPKNWPAT